jgi:hypothetical protein
MELIEGVELSRLCDYSFGDQSGQWSNIFTSFMKDANLKNVEFVSKLFEIKKIRNYMTLFIDNIRLYKRDIASTKLEDRPYIESLLERNDLLDLCSKFPDMNFIIFTNLEDTPIDEFIFDKIPNNVLSVNAINAIAFGGKVNPIPYGLQRAMHPSDNRNEIIKYIMTERDEIVPSNLLYVNHSIHTNPIERGGINEIFSEKDWAHVEDKRVDFYQFLYKIKEHKFMICPIGNAIDCHRNWEVLYLRRVPVMKRHPYLEHLYKDYPVLFVDNYEDVTEELLVKNENLYEQAQNIDLSELTLPKFFDKIVNKNLGRQNAS